MPGTERRLPAKAPAASYCSGWRTRLAVVEVAVRKGAKTKHGGDAAFLIVRANKEEVNWAGWTCEQKTIHYTGLCKSIGKLKNAMVKHHRSY